MRFSIKKLLGVGAILLLLLSVGFLIWAYTPLGPMPETAVALQSDEQLSVTTDPWFTFTPATAVTTGVIIYPGGRVDARAYTPLAREISAAGYLVILPPMPLNLAVTNPNAADEIRAAHPEIKQWVIGGHSLGGAMAANYVYTHPGEMDALFLWASYPADNNSLADQIYLKVISIYGSRENGAPNMAAATTHLPPDTEWAVIEGGNHAQFGWYGPQPGDPDATISRTDQQEQILMAMLSFLAGLNE